MNSIPFAYARRGPVDRTRSLRVISSTPESTRSIHFSPCELLQYFDHGTTLTPTLKTVDTIMQCQGQRGILEISFAEHEPGLYMFHAHQSEFAELGWMSHFEVV